MLVSVNDSANQAPVTNATFSHDWHNQGSGNYEVRVPQNTYFWTDSPSHKVQYTHSGTLQHVQVTLVKDVWP